MASNLLSVAGLSANFLGGILLWKYGIPNRVNREGHSLLILQQVDKEEMRKARFYDRMSSLGLTLLIIGFMIQLFDIFQSR
jgi:hypothetical protein